MEKILGLDLGTNSIGWAILEKDEKQLKLLNRGVRIFQEGVKIEKGVESSKAAERTIYRSARRLKFRRKLRKIETLTVLSNYGYCPKINEDDLKNWKYKKTYPNNTSLMDWLYTDNQNETEVRKKQIKNPYYYRNLAVTKKLDLNQEKDRFILGRVFYHIAQRRGFLSNRLEGKKESEGAVKETIAKITEEKGDKTLGQFFYEKYLNGEKIRDTYTHRIAHYLDEFKRICEIQKIPEELKEKLYKAIFFQRPLKSQRGHVGRCVFEPTKPRCAVSHPLFEEYRMLSFINNVKIKTPTDDKLRSLTNLEKQKISSLFFRKSKPYFDFEDIAKQLAPKNQYKYFKAKDKYPEDYIFNYHMKTMVNGCPMSAQLQELFGEDFMNLTIKYNRKRDNKEAKITLEDIWHVLYSFDSEERIIDFAKNRLNLSDEEITKFLKIHPKHEYAALSLKAIKKILPYLREGLIYPHAVFLANMEDILPKEIWGKPENRELIQKEIFHIIWTQNEEKQITDAVNSIIKKARDEEYTWSNEAAEYFYKQLTEQLKNTVGVKKYEKFEPEKRNLLEQNAKGLLKKQFSKNMGRGEFARLQPILERIKEFLNDNFEIQAKDLNNIYHPSAIEVYKPAQKAEDGNYYLGSPRISSIRNPMAMRCLHQLRRIINEMLSHGLIAPTTKIQIEMARDLLDSNERKALQAWQRDREKLKTEYMERIKDYYQSIGAETQPSKEDVLKYQLWEEQNHKCIYTGKEISISEFLGANPNFDIEHTIPRSVSFDNSQVNITLCENVFNRSVKRNKIPTELSNYEEILARLEFWKEKVEDLHKQVEQAKKQSKYAEGEAKDRAIQKKHRLRYEYDYWNKKYKRFVMQDVPEGFKNSQLVDTGIISRYARLYLKTLFDKVYTVKGNIVADFRVRWGLQEEYEKKLRTNHIHHCIDAITIAGITREKYDLLAHAWQMEEKGLLKEARETIKNSKPWPTFTEDVKSIEDDVLISHHTPDVLPKQSKKVLRKRGKIQYSKTGKPIYQQGDTARGSLHQETFYGAIEREVVNKQDETEKQIKYVVRKKLDDLQDNAIKNIVDGRIKEIIINGRLKEKELKKNIELLQKKLDKVSEQDELPIMDEIESLKRELNNIYCLPNKNGDPIPIKRVRVFQPTVTNPIHLKKHRDKSTKKPKAYKEDYHVANDGNYLMAIYEGRDDKGKVKRDFYLLNNLEAAQYYKLSVQKELKSQGLNHIEDMIPWNKMSGKHGLKLRCIIKIGTMVVLWEKDPKEVWDLEIAQLKKRLYKVIGLSNQRIKSSNGKIHEYATIVLRHHQEAMPASELKTQDGEFKYEEGYKAQRKLNHNQFNALVEGVDFKLTSLGELIEVN